MPENLNITMSTLDYENIWGNPNQYQHWVTLSLRNIKNEQNLLNLQTLTLLNAFTQLSNVPRQIFKTLCIDQKNNHLKIIKNKIQTQLNLILDALPNSFDMQALVTKIPLTYAFKYQQTIYLKRLKMSLIIPLSYMDMHQDLKPYNLHLMEAYNPNYKNVQLNTARLRRYQKRNDHIQNIHDWLMFNWQLACIVKRIKHQLLKWYQDVRLNTNNDDVIGFLLYLTEITTAQSDKFFKERND